jgi:HEAT repeat protein
MPDLWWWEFGVPGALLGMVLWSFLARRRERLKLWEQIARAQGRDGEVKASGFLTRRKVTARFGPSRIRITDGRGGNDDVVVEIEGPAGFSVLKLRRQLFRSPKREITIGDPSFDREFVLEGPALLVGGLLDQSMRRQLLSTIPGCFVEIGDGQLRAQLSEKDLRRILPLLLDIGRRLDKPVAAEQQVARNALQDPEAGVRLFNLLLLARERPGDPATREVLRKACKDRNAEVRLRAALELGEDGRDTLRHLAKTSPDDPAAAQAVIHLGRTLPVGSLRDILHRATNRGFSRTALAALDVLGQHGAATVGLLTRVLAETKGELACAAARALGTTGETAAEPPLLQALQSEDDDLREAAATALGRVGTVASVPALQEAAERSWLALGLRRAARQAIGEIQSRLEGASPGQLSLAGADGEMGRLSLATADAGQLALAPDAAGELALLPHGVEAEGERTPNPLIDKL